MSFREFALNKGQHIDNLPSHKLGELGVDYANSLSIPNVCSVSSATFTHGDLALDPEVEFNRRFYADPLSIVQIIPHVAGNFGLNHDIKVFNDIRDIIPILSQTAMSWILFSVSPYRYAGMNGHMVGVRTMGTGIFDTWDTTVRKPNQVLQKDTIIKSLNRHMYGKNPIIASFI